MRQLLISSMVAALVLAGCASTPSPSPSAEWQASKGLRSAVGKQPKRDMPDEAAEYWATRLKTPPGQSAAQLAFDANRAVELQASLDAQRGTPSALPPIAVTDLGPGNFGGRVRAIAIDPNDNETLLIGAVAGGMWKSDDRGSTWRVIDDFSTNMAVSSLEIDPDQPSRVFAGTGEGFFNSDAMSGAGIFVSEDFGETWSQLASTANLPDFFFVNRLARVQGTNILLAATRSGIYRSADLGASFTRVGPASVTGRGFVDLQVDPTNASLALAYLYGGASGFPPVVRVTAPGAIAGDYDSASATFGGQVTLAGVTGDIVLVNDGSATPTFGCVALPAGSLAGDIALMDRGTCGFAVKVKIAQNAGAIGAIVMNNAPGGGAFAMGGTDATITIPSVMITFEDGATLRAETGVTGSVLLDNSGPLASALFRSVDTGVTWQQLDADEGLPVTDYSRMEIGFGTGGTVYVAIANTSTAVSTRGLWKSTNGGLSFAQVPATTPFIERQGWYDLAIAVDPNDNNTVLMGAVDQFRTTNGGTTIQGRTTFWNPGAGQIATYVHADHHNYTYDPIDAGVVYTGTDGGIARSANNGLTYTQLNNGLNISQPYGVAVSPNNDRVIAGTQDNGTHLFFGNTQTWIEWSGGDGGYVAWDQQNDNFIYGARPFASLFGSSNLGRTESALPVPDTTGAQFITPFVLDPNDGNRLMIGTDNVFLTRNARSLGGASFIAATPAFPSGVSALAFSPVNSDVGFVGTLGGIVTRISGLNTTPASTVITGNLPVGNAVTRIEVDASDASGQTLYATLAGFFSTRVWKTQNGGTSWQSISNGLPAVPAFSIKVDPLDPDRLWLGTEIGLWTTTGNATNAHNWQRYEYGVPHTRVIEITWGDDDTLYATTHGRGTFRAVRNPFSLQAGAFTASAGCDADDILDIDESGTLALTVSNLSGLALSNVVLTLSSPTAAITLPAAPVAVGNLAAGGSSTVPVDIALANSPGVGCPARIVLDAIVSSDQGAFDASFDVPLSADVATLGTTFTDGAESADSLLTAENPIGSNAFVRSTAQANGGTSSWFVADPDLFSESSLQSPWFEVENSGALTLGFDLFYDTELSSGQIWDGAVLEMRTDTQDWFDIGGSSTVAYDGLTHLNGPIPARPAWGGNRQTWRSAIVNLGTTYAGQRAQFRFRFASDSNTGTPSGFFIDNFSVSGVTWFGAATCDVCSPPLPFVFADGFEEAP